MFTGIVSNLGIICNIIKLDSGMITSIKADIDYNSLKIGDSIAIDGACHSITKFLDNGFEIFSSSETLQKTIISTYHVDTKVNIELPVKVGDYLGGHNVSGHIDCIGMVNKIINYGSDKGLVLGISIPSDFTKYCIYKGSISVNGVSLTVNSINENTIELYIIPITFQKTNISSLVLNQSVNIECDIMAKYIESFIGKIGSK